jgi:hypothetical protein
MITLFVKAQEVALVKILGVDFEYDYEQWECNGGKRIEGNF